MLEHIGLNHIFDDGTICFCLVCKESLSESYPLDRDDSVRQHFRSERHEESARNLFKICVPDPKCESRNIKYLDIVNNSEFEVWEQGSEPSYVSKRDNHYVCLVCKDQISIVCGETEKIKYLQRHLESDLHVNNVKYNIWCTFHPNLDTNYIALNRIFMFCSFCQQFLVSKENSLLEFAADHLETELNNTKSPDAANTELDIKSDHSSNAECKKANLDSVSKTDPIYANSDSTLKSDLKEADSETGPAYFNSDSTSKSELKETDSDGATNARFELGLKRLSPTVENLQTTAIQSIIIQDNVKVESRETNLSPDTLELKRVNKSLDYKSLYVSQAKEELVVCSECNENIEVFNEDISFSMLNHSQKHKNLSFINDINEMEVQEKTCLSCHICHKQIEVFNKDEMLSYSYHIDNCHSDYGSSLVSIENVNNHYAGDQKSRLESDTMASLPNSLRDHLNFVAIDGEDLHCILCNCKLDSSSDGTNTNDVLLSHFSESYHKSQYKLFLQRDIVDVEGDQVLEEDNELFQGLQFNTSTKEGTVGPDRTFKNINLEQCKTNEKGLGEQCKTNGKGLGEQSKTNEKGLGEQCKANEKGLGEQCKANEKGLGEQSKTNEKVLGEPLGGKVRSKFVVLGILYKLVHANPIVEKSARILGEKKGSFYCHLCDEVLRCTHSGSELIKHLNEESHINKSKNGSNEEVKGKVRTRDEVLYILEELSYHKQVISQSIEYIGEKNGHFFCELCNEVVMCTLSGAKLVDHLSGLNHYLQKRKCREEQTELQKSARTPEHVYKILRQLAVRHPEVGKNIEVLGEKQGHFYCELCDEILMCTCSGRKLIDHLRDQKHRRNSSNHFV